MNLAHWMKLPPDVQDGLLDDLEARAKPATVDDTAALSSEATRLTLAERFGKYRFVRELKQEIVKMREKR